MNRFYVDGVEVRGAQSLIGTLTITMPAATDTAINVVTGSINIGANKLKTTDLIFRQDTANQFIVLAADNATPKHLVIGSLYYYGTLGAQADGQALVAYNADAGYYEFQARDNGVGAVGIARLVGAADPYVQIGRDDTGVALNAVTDGLVLQMGGGTGNEAANFGLGMAVNLGNAASEVEKRGYLNWVLTTATDASEAVRLDIGLMAAGALGVAASLSAVGAFNALLSLSVAGTKVIGAQGATVADATDAASVIARLNDLLARVRAHGLIAT